MKNNGEILPGDPVCRAIEFYIVDTVHRDAGGNFYYVKTLDGQTVARPFTRKEIWNKRQIMKLGKTFLLILARIKGIRT